MNKNDRSGLNPFTGKSHLDLVNDDKFLNRVYQEYYSIINNSQLIDNSEAGLLLNKVSKNLINAVESYLRSINRLDYIENYYDWEFHLIQEDTVNAFCMPGGKIVVYSGIFQAIESEEDLAFIVGHEMAHALLDHSRTSLSVNMAKAGLTTAARIGSIALGMTGHSEAGELLRAGTNIADISSHYLMVKPFGRQHEFEADRLGMLLIYWAGYNIEDIPRFWQRMSNNNPNTFDFFSTHPADEKRINAIKELILEVKNNNGEYSISDSNLLSENTNTFNCGNCGELLDEGAKFCTNCGTQVLQSLNCRNCGAPVSSRDAFCGNCGFKL